MSNSVSMTEQQRAAVEKKGRVIVSASAGSGKTFVMIRRLIELILGGESLDSVLAVTFTRKATAGMQEKLRAALIETINSEENADKKRHLKEQLGKTGMADISTIHAFCSNLVRNYFYLAEVSGDFNIVSQDDAVGRGLFEEAMESVIQGGYAEMENDADFALLLKTFVRSGRDASALKKIISDVYYKLRVTADYRSAAAYFSDFSPERFNDIAAALTAGYASDCAALLRRAEELLPEGEACPLKDCAQAKEYVRAVANAFNAGGLSAVTAALSALEKPRKGTGRANLSDEQLFLREEFSALKEGAASCASDFLDYNFTDDDEELSKYMRSGALVSAIYTYALKFDDEYSRLKTAKACLDYGDLEHLALKILRSEGVAAALREKYKYVFVDEYQDVNPLQEEILSLVGGENVFLVGDSKQAIYGFRGGKSVYFAKKAEEFGDGSLSLDRNFRSAKEILSFVNAVFSISMTERTAGANYTDMVYGGRYGDKVGRVKIYRCDESAEKKDITDVYSIEALDMAAQRPSEQARRIYSIINSCVNAPSAKDDEEASRIYSPEKGAYRKIEYGDIAILSRNDDNNLKELISFLVSRGVPVVSFSEVNVCDYPEVKQLIGVLQYLDNPAQDIPLCTAMLSPLGGFDEEELAQIKLFADGHSEKELPLRTFCGDCALYAEKAEGALAIKLKDFFDAADKLRMRAQTLSAAEVIALLLSEYAFETSVLSRGGGTEAMSGIGRFAAEAGDEDSLHEFLDCLRRLDYNVTYSENGGENAVKVLTVHRSKGLEFPVVILAGASSPFHSVKRETLVFDEGYGFAAQYYDYEKMRRSKTAFTRYAERSAAREQLRDELNLFYVALTRAEYALYIVYKGKKKGKSSYLAPGCYMDLVPRAVEEKYLSSDGAEELPQRETGAPVPLGGEAEEGLIRSVYKRGYAYEESCSLAAKSSATALLRGEQESEFYAGAPLVEEIDENAGENFCPDCFVDSGINADVGTAYHKFLEKADFSKDGAEEYERLKDEMGEEYYSLLSKEQCRRILNIPALKALAGARTVRERQFVVSFPANKFMSTSATDDVVYQGAIDLFAFTKNGCALVDYKYSRRSDEDIVKHYALQLRLYRATLAKLLNIAEESISVTVINIRTCRAVPVEL